MRLVLIVVSFVIAFTAPARVLAEGQWIAAPEMNALLFDGPVGPTSATAFKVMLDQHPVSKVVAFNSPGGMVVPALEIADEIHKRGINTVIMEDSICLSACAFMFMAGSTRYAVGQLGVHQISGTDDSSVTQFAVAEIYDSLLTFGTDPRFLNIMFQTASEDMYVFSPSELYELSINRTPQTPVKREPEQSNAPVEFDTIASSRNGSWQAVLMRNRSDGHYFCALESVEQKPLFRAVHYLTRRDAFVEILNIPLPMQAGSERLYMNFLSLNKEPMGMSAVATVEDAQTAWFNIDGEEVGQLFMALLALYGHMKLETEEGRLLGLYDLSGSLKSAQAFSRCILSEY